MKDKLYYLQNESAGYCGNSPMWWAKGGNGYTPRLDDAEQFTASRANTIIRSTRGSHRWKKWPVGLIDSLAHRTVDIQDLQKRKTTKKTSNRKRRVPDDAGERGGAPLLGEGPFDHLGAGE